MTLREAVRDFAMDFIHSSFYEFNSQF